MFEVTLLAEVSFLSEAKIGCDYVLTILAEYFLSYKHFT